VKLRFSKMHGAGNDFVVVDCRRAALDLDAARIARLGDRHFGIGFDQLLTIEPAADASTAFAYAIYNSDGSPAAQCGNGARCVGAWLRRDGAIGSGASRLLSPAGPVDIEVSPRGEVEQCGNGSRAFVRFVSDKGLTDKRSIRVETMSGIITPRLEDDGSITVDMGAPILEPARVPFDAAGLEGVAEGHDTLWPITVSQHGQDQTVLVSTVSMGNPHAVQVVDDVDAAPVLETGP
jgi:diaminopimelate epimerase